MPQIFFSRRDIIEGLVRPVIDAARMAAAPGTVIAKLADGQDGIFLGEGHTIKVKPFFPRDRLKEAGQIISLGIGCNIVKTNISDEQRGDLENHILTIRREIDIRMLLCEVCVHIAV